MFSGVDVYTHIYTSTCTYTDTYTCTFTYTSRVTALNLVFMNMTLVGNYNYIYVYSISKYGVPTAQTVDVPSKR